MASFFDWLLGNKKTDTKNQTNATQLKNSEASKQEQQSKAVQEKSASTVNQDQTRRTNQTQDQTQKTSGTQNQQQQSNTTGTQGSTGTQNTSGTSLTSQEQQQTQQQQQQQQQQSQVSNLDSATQAALQSILGTLSDKSGVLTGESLSAILGNSPVLQSLQQKALGGGEDIDAIVEAAKGAAQLSYEENEAPGIQKKINATGSEDNTLAMLLRNKGATDLATKTANVEGQLRLQGSAQDTATKQAAINAGLASGTTGSAGVGDVSSIAQILKGAQQTASSSGTSSGTSTGTTSGTTSQQTSQQTQTAQNATSSQSTSATSATQSATESATKLQSQIDEALKSITDTKTATEQLTNFLSSIFSSEIDLSQLESNTTGESSTGGSIWDILKALPPRAS